MKQGENKKKLGFAALDSLAIGVLVVDTNRRLRIANKNAEKVLNAGYGIGVQNGFLRAHERENDEALCRAIEQAKATPSHGRRRPAVRTVALHRRRGRPLSLMVVPLGGEMLGVAASQFMAMIFIDDPERRPRPTPDAITEIWGLTPAEARLAAALVEGERLESYATQNDISLQTAKTHLKRVFGKMGLTRQSDLIREVLMNPVLHLSARQSDKDD